MKKIALIVDAPNLLNDRIFASEDNLQINKMYGPIKEYLNSFGMEIHTLDKYENLNEVDYFILWNWNSRYFFKLFKKKKLKKTILIASEPETFERMHSLGNIKKLLAYFPIIMTWNKEAIDGNRILPWQTIQIQDINKQEGIKKFSERKFICCIANNKSSEYEDELYSERKKVIKYAEKKELELDLFGNNWENENVKRCWRGSCTGEEKGNIYQNYKFALALESTKNLNGFISEKIFDCLNSGIVPIYAGSKNIDEYVPANCYIDYFSFENENELFFYLENMSEIEWNNICRCGKEFLYSDKMRLFSPEAYCERLICAFNKVDGQKAKYNIAFLPYLRAMLGWIYCNIKAIYINIRMLLGNIKRIILKNNKHR